MKWMNVFDSFRYFEPVKFFENRSDVVVFWGFSDSTGESTWIAWRWFIWMVSMFRKLEGGQVSVDSTIDLLTQDYGTARPDTSINLRHPAEAWSMCRYIWGGSGYLRTTFHLHLPTFLHSIRAAGTMNCWFQSNCEMFPFWTNISVYKMTYHQET